MVESIEREGLTWGRFTFTHTYGERLRQAWDLARFVVFLRRERPDVVLSYCMFPNIVSALTWKLGGARVCIWNQRDEGRGRVARWVEGLSVRQVRLFLANASHGGEFLTNVLGVSPEQVRIIHNGIELPPAVHDRATWRRRLGLHETAFVACMAANLHGYKDHETLVTAWRIVVDRLRLSGRDAHLLLAGHDGDRREAVERQIHEIGLDDHVKLIGSVSDVTGLLRTVDLAALSSYNEGLPNAVLEAMSAGLAVVATDYPGIREAVGSVGDCLLVRPRDPQDMADKIIEMAEDSRRRAAAGAQVGCASPRSSVSSEWPVPRSTSSPANWRHVPGRDITDATPTVCARKQAWAGVPAADRVLLKNSHERPPPRRQWRVVWGRSRVVGAGRGTAAARASAAIVSIGSSGCGEKPLDRKPIAAASRYIG